MAGEMLKEWRYFTIFNHEAEEKYLRQKANRGWLLDDIRWLFQYRFVKAAPRDRIYRLDHPSGRPFERQDDRDEYLQMYEDFGWHHQMEWMGFDYFWTEHPDAGDEIFSDTESKNNMLRRVFITRILLLLVLFGAVLLPQLWDAVKEVKDGAPWSVPVYGVLVLGIVYLILILYLVYRLIRLNRENRERQE